MKYRFPKIPLMLIFMYFSEFFFSGLNWWWFISFERALFGDALVNAHLAFTILGTVLFFLVGSPYLFWPYRYGPQMQPRSRRNCIFLAMIIAFLSHDWPLWLIEFWTIWEYGWIHSLQGISMCTLTFSTAIGLFGCWLGYAWKMSKMLQRHFGSTNYNLSAAVAGGASSLGGLAVSRVAGVDATQRI